MKTLIRICDIVSAGSLILALNMVTTDHRWWLFYAATNIIFMVVAVYKKLPGWAVAGLILFVTGIRNYFIGS